MDTPSAASAAATSSCVDSGLQPDHETSAPAACRARTNTAVSFVTCRQPAMRMPRSGFVSEYRFVSAMRTGMRDSAHSMRSRPASAKLGSAIFAFAVFVLMTSPGCAGAEPANRALARAVVKPNEIVGSSPPCPAHDEDIGQRLRRGALPPSQRGRIDVRETGGGEPLRDAFGRKPEPGVRELRAHPFLAVRDQISNHEPAARTQDARELGNDRIRPGGVVQREERAYAVHAR